MRRTTLAVVAALIGCLSIAPSAHAELPSDFFGLAADHVFQYDTGPGEPEARQEMLGAQSAIGVQLIRRVFTWREIETAPAGYEFGRYDRYVGDLAEHGITVLPIIFDPPDWHSSRPPGDTERGVYPPEDPDSMGGFAAVLVDRYGPGGDFWDENPGIPELPIRSWQVWNEPNYPYYWLGGINAAEYVDLLRATGNGIKAADPGAEVVTAGLVQSGSPKSVDLVDFMNGMYAAGALGTFDTLAMHPYAATPEKAMELLDTTRSVMDSHGDSSPIWATEFGWASQGKPSSVTVDEPRQALYLEQMMRGMIARRDTLRLRGAVWWSWQDAVPYAGASDYWGLNCGLRRLDGSAKPALAAYAGVVASSFGAGPPPAEPPPPPDVTGPGPFALLGPADGLRTRELRPTLRWQPAGDAETGLALQEVWIDGARAAAGLPAGAAAFTPPANLRQGGHSWRIVAIDGAGNARQSDTRRFTLDRRAPRLRLRVAGRQRLRRVARRGLVLYATCSEGCRFSVRAKVGRSNAGRAARTLSRKRSRLVVKISRSTARRIARGRSARLSLRATVADDLGNRRTLTRRVTVRR